MYFYLLGKESVFYLIKKKKGVETGNIVVKGKCYSAP